MKVIELLSCLTFLAAFTAGVEIQCEYQIYDWKIGPLYECSATLTNVENPATVTAITGTHLAGKGNEDVKGFSIDFHRMITTIPKGIENFFANLEAFQWAYGNISTIDSSTFEPFKNLLVISLEYNKLVTLNGDLFQHTRKLKQIDFGNNLLQHVGHDLLTGLTDLTYAHFGNNPCISEGAETPEQIEELNLQLPIQCPPLATTPDPPTTTISTTNEPTECPIRCTMNEEADEMKNMLEELEKVVTDEIKSRIEMKKMIGELQNAVRELNSTLTKLENVVREIQIPILSS